MIRFRGFAPLLLLAFASGAFGGGGSAANVPASKGAASTSASAAGAAATFTKYCYACHSKSATMGGVSLDQLLAAPPAALGEQYPQWDKVARVLEERRMPPEKMPQPDDAVRAATARWIRTRLSDYAVKYAGDPGRVTVRRLTSGEYLYSLRDLTGAELKLDTGEIATDSVGGEGFASFGDVQFMQDAGLERYLESAKRVADHAVIGAGPLSFYDDPGKSGFELSAIARIQAIYTKYGFRATSGEGGKPYGLDRFGKAFYAAWRYKHRAALGEPKSTLATLAAREGLTTRFAEHIWAVVNQASPTYPTSEVVAKWLALPAPSSGTEEKAVREGCAGIQKFLVDWPRFLLGAGGVAEGGQGDERALVLTDEEVQAVGKHRYRFLSFTRSGTFGKPGPPLKQKRIYVSAVSANPSASDKPVVLFRNATVRFRKMDRSAMEQEPLTVRMDEESLKRLGLQRANADRKTDEFAVPAGETIYFDLLIPEGAGSLELQAEADIGPAVAGDAVLRCTINDKPNTEGRPVSALLGHPASAGFKQWKKNVLEFAAVLPQISHGEPTPSDKDPIPAPYDNTYNQPERDSFHTRVKYYRRDRFLVEKMLDDATRVDLDIAWNDLKASFEYHDALLNFVAGKYKLDLKKKSIGELSAAEIEAIPAEPRRFVKELREDYDSVMKAQFAGQPGHLNDCLEFAARAWRRPLTAAEKDRLRSFYVKSREAGGLDHPKAVRLLLARILVSPAFLYRLEVRGGGAGGSATAATSARPLEGWDLASRLSFFLWASVPDAELRRAAGAGELANPAGVERQVKRMLADPKARRFATEFFGQWLGFYRFDQYRGVDPMRFPEFTDEVKSAMYDEAVSFFEHVVRQDRPVRELIAADYTFLNTPLARHYGIKQEVKAAPGKMAMVTGANAMQRGGLLRLGAVLTATSAPLRTSPVKRGDWMLRRVLGTPTPPPPANAGSIPADDKQFAGQTVRERLAAHMRNPTCAACHAKIDPLGFPFERYDPVGRWRESYSDGKPIQDAGTLATADQKTIAGIDGLVDYLLHSQEKQVMRTMSQKLVGYALGRTMLASDQPLLDKMAGSGSSARFSKLITELVLSKQFRYRRDQADQQQQRQQGVKGAPRGAEGGL